MRTMQVYCSYHTECGHCTEEGYNDAKSGRNPSGMVQVQFEDFHHGVPLHTLTPYIATVYKSGDTVFVPTELPVVESFLNGHKGEQLWLQILDGRLTGNYWTRKQIMTLNPIAVNI